MFFFICENIKRIFWKTITGFSCRNRWLHPSQSLVKLQKYKKERGGWGEELKPYDNSEKACASSSVIYCLLPLQRPPSHPPIRPDHASSESPPWGRGELNF